MSEALRLAHELILAMRDTDEEHWDALEEAAAELRRLHAALAEPEQKPVAWADEIIDDLQAQYDTDGIKEIDSGDALIRLDEAIAAVEEAEKRHTAPPQRRPLTDEEIRDLWSWSATAEAERTATTQQHAFARAIERAHGIKQEEA